MFRLALSNLKRRKLRVFLLALAIIISVSFFVAIVVLGQSIGEDVRSSSDEAEVNIAELIRGLYAVLIGFNILGFLVGLFVIKNTFTVVLAQRAKELAMARTIGASKLDIFRLVITEAVMVGLVGALVGIAAGLGLAQAVLAIGSQFGWGFDGIGLSLNWHVFVWPLAMGLFASVVAAVLPAIKASRRPPLEVLTGNELLIKNVYVWRLIIGCIVLAVGLLATLPAFLIELDPEMTQSAGFELMFYLRMASLFFGFSLVFVSFAILSPIFAKIFASLAMRLLRRGRWLGWHLSASNIWRQPVRSATTANALMIGITLVTLITVVLSSFRTTMIDFVEQFLPYNWAVIVAPEDEDVFGLGEQSSDLYLPDDAFVELRDFHDDVIVYGFREGRVSVNDERSEVGNHAIIGLDVDADFAEKLGLGIDEGDFDNFEAGQLLASEWFLDLGGWSVGDQVTLSFDGRQVEKNIVIGGSFDSFSGDLMINNDVYYELSGEERYNSAAVINRSGDSDQDVRQSLEVILEDYEDLVLFGREDIIEIINAIFDVILNAFRVLLSLSFVVAIAGLFNTLLLAIFERTREIGLLRALGMTGGMFRRVIGYEAVQIATLGVLLGTLLGIAFAWGFIEVAVRDTFNTQAAEDGQPAFRFAFHVPLKEILIAYGAAVVLALVASLGPAFKATRMKIIEALRPR